MKTNISKYALLLLFVLTLASCTNDEIDDVNLTMQTPTFSNKSFGVKMDDLQTTNQSLKKALLLEPYDFDVDFSFAFGDSLSILTPGNNTKLISKMNGKSVVFNGEVADANAYYALFPYQKDATLDGDVIKARIPDLVSTAMYGYIPELPEGAFGVAYTTDSDRNFQLKNVTSILSFQAQSSIDPRFSDRFTTIVLEANKNIAGDVIITIDDNGNPAISGGTSNVITCKKNYDFSVCSLTSFAVIPVDDVDITVRYYMCGNELFSKSFKHLNLKSSQINLFTITDPELNDMPDIQVNFVSGIDGLEIPPQMAKWKMDESHGCGYYITFPEIDSYYLKNNIFKGFEDIYGSVFPTDYDEHRLSPKLEKGEFVYKCFWEEKIYLEYQDCSSSLWSNNRFLFEKGKSHTVTLPELPDFNTNWIGTMKFDHWELDGKKYYPGDKITFSQNTTLDVVSVPVEPQRNCIVINANGGTFADGSTIKTINFFDFTWENNRPTSYPSMDISLEGQTIKIVNGERINSYESHEAERNEVIELPISRKGYRLMGVRSLRTVFIGNEEHLNDPTGSVDYKDAKVEYFYFAVWSKTCEIKYCDENGNVVGTSDYLLYEDDTYFESNMHYFDLDYKLTSSKKQIAWKTQDGIVLRMGRNSLSILPELKDLILTPIFE